MLKRTKKTKAKESPAKPKPAAEDAARSTPAPDPKVVDAAQRHRNAAAERQRAQSRSVKEIGELPPVADQGRRDSCAEDLEKFLRTYLSSWFYVPFGRQQKRYIQIAEDVVRNGGQHAQAMSRGWAKTTIAIGATVWAGLEGYCDYTLILGATDDKAKEILELTKACGEKMPLLLADFPEAFYAVRKLEGATQKCATQLYRGELTNVEWSSKGIVFPMIPGAKSAGYKIGIAGITSAFRGALFAGMDGKAVRPDLVIIDDPQTKESAKSFQQTKDRIELIDEDVMGLNAPDKTISILMPCTIIRKGDLADQYLDRKKRPYWRGLKSGALTSLPKNIKLWDQYNEVRAEGVAQDKGLKPGDDFYLANQDALHEGCESNWPEMFNPKTEKSAIQRAMNKYYEMGRAGFMAEYMNDPEGANPADLFELDPLSVRKRLNRLPMAKIPKQCDRVVAKIDVQHSLLWYAVGAFQHDFSGSIVEYGWFPDQGRRQFGLSDLNKTLHEAANVPDVELEAALLYGLQKLGEHILDREWEREDGAKFTIKNCHVDIKDPKVAIAVARFCRLSKWKSILTPSEGHSVGHKKRISQWTPKDGENFGPPASRREREYRLGAPDSDGLRKLLFDKHFWFGRVHRALLLPEGSSGALTLYGEQPNEHMMVSEHLTSHYSVDRKYGEIEFKEYEQRVGTRDDLLDCVSGCLQAASQEGCRLQHGTAMEVRPKKPKKRRTITAEKLFS